MATKAATNIANAAPVTAGGTKAAPGYTSAALDLSAGLGAAVNVRLVNGSTAPGSSNQPVAMAQVSADGAGNWVDHTAIYGSLDANGEGNGTVEFSAPHKAARVIAYGSNQASTITIDLVQLTAV